MMHTQIKIFLRVQSYNKDFSEFEEHVNAWIADMEQQGGELIDVRVQVKASGDNFTWVMFVITVIYWQPLS